MRRALQKKWAGLRSIFADGRRPTTADLAEVARWDASAKLARLNSASMPPIKRTKFKLTSEQLLDMFFWLKLIRAFDERLSILVRQGKVRSGVYTGIGQEAIIVGTCFGLRK